MISVLIAVAIFFYYEKLAARFGKKKWLYGFAGVVLCFGLQFIFGLMYGMAGIILDPNHYSQDIDFHSFTLVNILSWIFSVIVALLGGWYLNRNWKKNR
ncbi:hypothetical protein [Chryseobacterium indologenes]|uniref:Uncharacterized protein n=1 Tax=Chryseobacterium indologenes TaxID=253 RepID=A0A0N0IX05_CHRID|nr:hypothetical protein [Chryseobacterium indologenes]KPE51843.1 hypothetical protein AOB46_06350 [Chryseobacterium indologenes]